MTYLEEQPDDKLKDSITVSRMLEWPISGRAVENKGWVEVILT